MTEKEVLRRFSAHRLEGALRFIAHEVRVGTEAPDLRCRTSAVKSSGSLPIARSPMWC